MCADVGNVQPPLLLDKAAQFTTISVVLYPFHNLFLNMSQLFIKDSFTDLTFESLVFRLQTNKLTFFVFSSCDLLFFAF